MARYQRILVPVDGSEESRKAFTAAMDLARQTGGQLRLVHVLDELENITAYEYSAPVMDELREQARSVMEQWSRDCAAAGLPCETALLEEPGSRLGEVVAKEASAWSADLVVVGSHGRRGLGRILLGSGAEQIVRHSPVPAMVIREPHPGV